MLDEFEAYQDASVPDVSINVIYSDDVRTEATGKVTYVGVYGHEIIVPQYPAVLTNLFVSISVRVPVQSHDNVQRVIFKLPDGKVIERPVDVVPPPTREIKGPAARGFSYIEHFSPLIITERGKVKVRIDIGGKLYAGNAVEILSVAEANDRYVEQTVFPGAVEAVLGYAANYLDKAVKDRQTAASALLDVIQNLVSGRSTWQVVDENFPAWFVSNRHEIWIMKTAPWHDADNFGVYLNNNKAAFDVIADNAVATLIRVRFVASTEVATNAIRIEAIRPGS